MLTLVLCVWLALIAASLSAQEVGLAARVNGVAITVFRLERYFEDYLREQGRNVATLRSPAAYKRLKREALERLIVRELLVQEAARLGLEVTDDEVAAARSRVMAGYREPQAFHRRLEEAGFSDATFAEHLRQDLLAQQALVALADHAEPDADTVRQAYQEQRERFVRPEQAMPEAQALVLVRRQLVEQRRALAEAQAVQALWQKAQIQVLLPL